MTDTKNLGPGMSYEYDYDFSIDDTPLTIAAAGERRTRALVVKVRKARTISATPTDGTPLVGRKLLRMRGAKTFMNLTYQLLVYVHPKTLLIDSLGDVEKKQYLADTVTMWRSHHEGVSDVYVDVSAAISKFDTGTWEITVVGNSIPNALPNSDDYNARKLQEDQRIEPLSKVLEKLEIEER